MEDIELVFKNGKVVRAKAEKGEGLLKELLKTGVGAKRIGVSALATTRASSVSRKICSSTKRWGTAYIWRLEGLFQFQVGKTSPASTGTY